MAVYKIIIKNSNGEMRQLSDALGAWIQVDRGSGYEHVVDLHLPSLRENLREDQVYLTTSEGNCTLPFREEIRDPLLEDIG